MRKKIPVYSLNQFKKDSVERGHYQVEVFDKNRNFKVEYPHRHDNFYEILFLTKGGGSYTIDFKTYPLHPDHVFFVSPGQVHSISFSDDILGYIFLFTEEFYLLPRTDKNQLLDFPFFHGLTYENPPFRIPDPASLSLLFEMIIRETSGDIPSDEIALAGLDLILNICKKNYPHKEEHITGKGRRLVRKFKQLIDEHIQQIHLVQWYASQLNVTPSHLNETVKRLTGLTAKELVKERLIIEIKHLLSHTELNINEIAESLNFEDQSYFSRFFKKNTGETPHQFRNKAL